MYNRCGLWRALTTKGVDRCTSVSTRIQPVLPPKSLSPSTHQKQTFATTSRPGTNAAPEASATAARAGRDLATKEDMLTKHQHTLHQRPDLCCNTHFTRGRSGRDAVSPRQHTLHQRLLSLTFDHFCACRGVEDQKKRDALLADKYLRPLTAYGRVMYTPKEPRAASDGEGRPVYMSKEMTRVTPPIKGTSVYPDDNWQLPS